MVGEITQTIHCRFLDPVELGCTIAHTNDRENREDDVKDGIQSHNLREVSLGEGLTSSGELSNYGCWKSRQQSENVQRDQVFLVSAFPSGLKR